MSKDPTAAAELKRRGTLVAKLTAGGSRYFTAKKNARGSYPSGTWRNCSTNPADLEPLKGEVVTLLQSEGGCELVSVIRDEYKRLDYLLRLDEVPIPKVTRPLLGAWRDEAWSIVSAGENDSLDGCYWLLHTDNLRHALFAVHAPEIRQAADALVRWCEQRVLPATTEAPPTAAQIAPDDPEQMVSPTNIATRFGLTEKQKDRLRHRLIKWRGPHNCRQWTEVPDRGPKQPQYLYRLGSIRHLIDAVKAG